MSRNTGGPHGFEGMEVFALAVEFVAWADAVSERLARRHPALNDQLQPAAVSIVANLGEGGAELSWGDKRRFYRYALRSAGECAALLYAAERIGALDPDRIAAGLEHLRLVRINLLRLLRATRAPSSVQEHR